MVENVLKAENIVKKFPGVVALDHVTFDLKKGEVHGLVGQNGAGKSTFVKILNGIYNPDEGRIILHGKEVVIKNPMEAKKLGITLVHQEVMLVPHLTVAENILLGKMPLKSKFLVDWAAVFDYTEKVLKELGANIDPRLKVKELSVGEQKLVQVARALADKAQILCFDEPTTALTPMEKDSLFEVIRRLKNAGKSVIYITHYIDEIFDICDRVTVLRDGKKIATETVSEIKPEEVVKMMLGREVSSFYVAKKKRITEIANKKPLLVVNNLSTIPEKAHEVALKNVSFKLYKGEILGVVGLLGAGKSELGKALFGIEKIVTGRIQMKGKDITIKSPLDALKYGILYAPENRQVEGLIPEMSVKENITITTLNEISKFLGIIDMKKEREISLKWVKDLNIVTPSLNAKVSNLSGGNQQKVVIAKILQTKPKIIIFDEPTMGIDVGAKVEIRRIIANLSEQGISVILLSSDVEEVLSLADRIIVMVKGRVTREMVNKGISKDEIISLICKVEVEKVAA